MPSDMSFNVTALDNASKTFVKMASQVERLSEKIDKLDRKEADVKINVRDAEAKRKLNSIERQTEMTAKRSGSKLARFLLNPVTAQLGLLPGIAAASAAASGAALGAVSAGFGAIAIAAQKDNEQVKESFTDLWDHVRSSTKDMTTDVVPYITGMAAQLRSGFDEISSDMRRAFDAVGPQLTILTDGVVRFAQNAMPGLARAVERSGEAVRGLADLLAKTGTGLGSFFDIISANSSDVGRGLSHLGDTLDIVLRGLGRLVAQFSTAWAQVGPEFNRMLGKMLDVLTEFTSGALDSFVNTFKIAARVVGGFLDVVKPIADELGGMAGVLLGVAAGWKLVAGPVSKIVGLFGKLSGAVGVAQRKVSRFASVSKKQMVGAGTAIAAAAAVAFSAWSSKQQQARVHAQQLATATDTLAQTLKKTSGVVDERINPALTRMAYNVQDGADGVTVLGIHFGRTTQSIAENLRTAGISLQTFNGAVKGGRQQTELFNQQLVQAYRSGKIDWKTFGLLNGALYDFQGTIKGAKAKQRDMNRAMAGGKTAADNLKFSMEELNNLLYGTEQATISYKNNLHQLTQGLKDNGLSFDIDTQAGRDNKSQLISTAQAAQEHFKKVKEQTGSLDAASAAFKQDKLQAYKNMVQLGLTKDEAQRLINKYYDVPGDVNTDIGTPGMKKAQEDIDALDDKINGLNNKSISVSVKGEWTSSSVGLGHIPSDISGYASGGWVAGPGGPTSDSIPARLSNNEFVVNARSAAKHRSLLETINGRGSSGPGYAGGGVVRSVDVNTSASVAGIMGDYHKWMRTGLSNMAKAWAEYASSTGGGGGNWAGVVHKALAMLGLPQSWAGITQRQIQIESGGNPRAINNWDVNAANGTPSKGLLQTIGPTFHGYNIPGLGGIYNPLANVVAGIRYAMATYGSLPAVWPTRAGYESGSWSVPRTEPALVHRGEMIIPADEAGKMRSAASGSQPEMHFDVMVRIGDRDITEMVDVQISRRERESSQKLRAGRR